MEQNKDDYAIVVGIDTYPKLDRLRSAHVDASKFAEWLAREDGGNLPHDNIHLVTGPPTVPSTDAETRPEQKDIDEKFTKMGVEVNKRIGRRLYFYFAGHGFSPAFDDLGLLMITADEKHLNRNVGLRMYRHFFHNHYRFDEIVYIMDCCRDASFRDNIQLNPPSFTLDDPPTVLDLQELVALAAANGEKAYAFKNEDDHNELRGVFTQAVLEGLEKADDGLGRVTAASLSRYIRDRVPNLIASQVFTQRPQFLTLPDKPMVFAVRTPDVSTFKVHITVAPKLKGTVSLYNSFGDQLDVRDSCDATRAHPWEVTLSRNIPFYLVVHSAVEAQQAILPVNVTKEPYVVQFK